MHRDCLVWLADRLYSKVQLPRCTEWIVVPNVQQRRVNQMGQALVRRVSYRSVSGPPDLRRSRPPTLLPTYGVTVGCRGVMAPP